MLTWLKQYAATHLFYIILLIGGVVAFRVWLNEHDARLKAEETVQESQAKVADLQQQIVAVNNAAAQKVQTIVKIVHDAQTPAQVVLAAPQLTDLPLNTRVAPDNPAQVSVDAQPFIQLLGQAKEDAINLKACEDTAVLKDQQLDEKDKQIATLTKKPSFFHRVLTVAKTVGIGVGIGILIAH